MEEPNYVPNSYPAQKEITEFDSIMFLTNPARAMKLAEVLSYISEYTGLRDKLLRATKDSSFYLIADAFDRGNQYMPRELWESQANTRQYKELWGSGVPRAINTFLGELEKNQEVVFQSNDIEDVKRALDAAFPATPSPVSADTGPGIISSIKSRFSAQVPQ